jgi:hypothetical protein
MAGPAAGGKTASVEIDGESCLACWKGGTRRSNVVRLKSMLVNWRGETDTVYGRFKTEGSNPR